MNKNKTIIVDNKGRKPGGCRDLSQFYEMVSCCCGAIPKIKYNYADGSFTEMVYWVECKKCGEFTSRYKDIDEAVAEWTRKGN